VRPWKPEEANVFGIGGDPYQGQPTPWDASGGGPLQNLQGEVASVLNGNGTGSRLYIPLGPGQPVAQIPNPALFQPYRPTAQYRPAAPLYTGQHRSAVRLTLGDVGVLFLGLTVVAAVVAAIADVALLFIK
jgi:hypothetical protein